MKINISPMLARKLCEAPDGAQDGAWPPFPLLRPIKTVRILKPRVDSPPSPDAVHERLVNALCDRDSVVTLRHWGIALLSVR